MSAGLSYLALVVEVLKEQIRKLDVACALTGRYTQMASAVVSAAEFGLAVLKVSVFHGPAPVFEVAVGVTAGALAAGSFLAHKPFKSRRVELKEIEAAQVRFILTGLARADQVSEDTIDSLTSELTS